MHVIFSKCLIWQNTKNSVRDRRVRQESMRRQTCRNCFLRLGSDLIAALAKKYARSVTCYTCGTDDSLDVAAGRELAGKLDFPWIQCRISEDNIEETIREIYSQRRYQARSRSPTTFSSSRSAGKPGKVLFSQDRARMSISEGMQIPWICDFI